MGLGKQSSLIRVYPVCHSVCILWTHHFVVKPHCLNFRIITAIFGVSKVFGFLRYFFVCIYGLQVYFTHFEPSRSSRWRKQKISKGNYLAIHKQNFRIFNGCEAQIENSIIKVTVWHRTACRVMPSSYSRDRIFNWHRTVISGIPFLR